MTEFGPRGHWQAAKTAWGMPTEDTSTVKAAHDKAADEAVVRDNLQCLGSYVFLWHGKHHEKTHTWHNGDRGQGTTPISRAFTSASGADTTLLIPAKPGAFRLFLSVRDGEGGGATVNRPIRVE